MDNETKLDKIAEEIKKCNLCQKGKIGKPVPGEGNPNAEVVFIGEAPGKKEAETGRPFVGRSGQLLRGQIRKIGLKEEKVFITSPVKYLPRRGTPSKSDIVHERTHLAKQLRVIQPKIIVLLGNTASLGALEKAFPITKWHGKTIKRDYIVYFFSFHPAAALRFSRTGKEFLNDFKKLKNLLF